MGFPGGSVVKNLPVIREMWVQSLGREDPVEVEMATHSSIIAWEIPWSGEPRGLYSVGSQRVEHDWATNTFFSFFPPQEYWNGGDSDVWSAIFGDIVLGHHNLHPYKTANLTPKCCVFWLLHLSLALSSGLPIPWDNNFEIKPANNPTWPLSVQVKKKSCISLTLT